MLVLASASPRRVALLRAAGVAFVARGVHVDETPPPGAGPREVAHALALRKARAVAATPAAKGHHVLGADTVVELDGLIIGKPRDAEDAVAILRLLAGRTHRVHTGVAVVDSHGVERSDVVTADVTMAPLRAAEIDAYVATGEPMDKAGAYGLQGLGGALVSHVRGDRTTVVGLPVQRTLELLRDAGADAPPGQPTPKPN